jgi:hypothetical protein
MADTALQIPLPLAPAVDRKRPAEPNMVASKDQNSADACATENEAPTLAPPASYARSHSSQSFVFAGLAPTSYRGDRSAADDAQACNH